MNSNGREHTIQPLDVEQQKRLYEAINDTTPDLVYVFDLNYRFVYANRALLEMWGRSFEDSVGRGLRELGYEEWHAEMHEREIDKVVATKAPIRGVVSFPHATLGKRIYDYIFSPVLNSNGEVEAIAGTTRDISDIKNAEEGLRESEERFRNLVSNATAPIVVLLGEKMVVEVINDAYAKLVGLKREDLLGKPLFDVIPQVYDYYFPLLNGVRLSGNPVMLYESPYSVIANGVKVEGFVHAAYEPYRDSSERIIGVMAIHQDVTPFVRARTALEASESRFRNVIEEATVGTALFEGPRYQLTLVNDHMLQLWQRDRSIVGKELLEFMPELEGQSFPGYLKTVYETGSVHTETDALVQLMRNGKMEHVYMDYSYKALRNIDGQVYAILVSAADVTERFFARKRLEESENRLRHLSEKLEDEVDLRTLELRESNENLQRFAHVASHDLKEPVRKIKTFAGRLKEQLADKLDDASSLYLQKIQQSTDRMVSMIDGVLAYSSINEESHQNEKVNLNDVLENIKNDLELAISDKQIDMQLSGLPTVEGARVLLYQLFYNLINNSIKFSANNRTPRIQILAEPVNGDKQLVRIIVSDNGIGFDQKFANSIFNTFTRLNSKDKFEGTGLGLALCKKIVERHRGTISASGEKDKGACFTIVLPINQSQSK